MPGYFKHLRVGGHKEHDVDQPEWETIGGYTSINIQEWFQKKHNNERQ